MNNILHDPASMRDSGLSEKALLQILHWAEFQREDTTVPHWDEYFLKIAFDVRERSKDAQTKCGAVIVSPHNEIMATGYNGHIRDIRDDILPNLRPDKYPFIVHAEHNAILSCARRGMATLNCKMYVTGHPCDMCLQYIWQAGIKEVIYGHNPTHMQTTDDDRAIRTEILAYLMKDLTIRHVDYPKNSTD